MDNRIRFHCTTGSIDGAARPSAPPYAAGQNAERNCKSDQECSHELNSFCKSETLPIRHLECAVCGQAPASSRLASTDHTRHGHIPKRDADGREE